MRWAGALATYDFVPGARDAKLKAANAEHGAGRSTLANCKEPYARSRVPRLALTAIGPHMCELEDEIALIEFRSEQLLMHLRQLPPESAEAAAARASLDTLCHRLKFVKAERDRLVKELWQAA